MNIRKIRKQIHFHSTQRWAVTIILLLIVAVIVHGKLTTANYVKSPYNNEEHITILDKINRSADRSKKSRIKQKLNPTTFNPNEVTAQELMTMGIKEKSAKTWEKYTRKGGKFYRTEDLKKLYFMNEEIYSQLESFVEIPKLQQKHIKKKKGSPTPPNQINKRQFYSKKTPASTAHQKLIVDSLVNDEWSEKLEYNTNFKSRKNEKRSGIKENYTISINETDSLELQILKGIGPVLASRIIKYKEQLGGFHNKNQLLEVYGVKPILLSNILDQLSFEGELKKIKLNHVLLEDLVKHPYFNYQTAQIFINYRKQHGDFESINDVKKIKIIKEYWLEDTAPYFDYEPS